MSWSLCSRCLTLVASDARCESHPHDRHVDLSRDSDAGLLPQLWTRPRYDRRIGRLRVAAQFAAAFGAVSALFLAMAAWHDTAQPWRDTTCFLLPMLGLAALALRLLGSLERVRRRRFLAVPQPVPRARPVTGRVVGGGAVESPLTGQRGCAYGAVLAADALLWHRGASAGVVVETDDGQTLYLPPGPLRLAFRESAGCAPTRRALEQYLDDVAAGGRAARNRMLMCAPFPHNYHEACLRLGDRVEVVAATVSVPRDDGTGCAYRAPGVRLESRGVPWVRLLA